jgi:hypothetical protein
LKKNETIILEAVKSNEYAFKFASDELRDNETFILEAVK